MPNNLYQLSEDEKAEIDQAMKKLLEVCQIHRVPMFASAAVGNSEDGTEYMNITYGAPAHNIQLKDDQIRHHILIANGFHAVPPREDITFNMGEII